MAISTHQNRELHNSTSNYNHLYKFTWPACRVLCWALPCDQENIKGTQTIGSSRAEHVLQGTGRICCIQMLINCNPPLQYTADHLYTHCRTRPSWGIQLQLVLMHRTEQKITFYGHFIPKKYNHCCIVAWILRVRMTKARSPTLTTSAGRDGDAHVLLNADKVNRPRASSRNNSASRSTTRRWVTVPSWC